ncbi:hypothetical protein [Myxosarcina sp. GI1]|uniref:hypothetical protein n=1 Tax=Myxosarcina sp. GI1 TaxID=1541065 RepID=UPI0012E0581C|nr:hypothetical protein [Myxosarcina sp. GI1]
MSLQELDEIVSNLENNPNFVPFIEEARIKMANSKLPFEEALHKKIEANFKTASEADFEQFLNEKSQSLKEKLSNPEIFAVFQRLKNC